MRRILFVILWILPNICAAQTYNYNWGLAAPVYFRPAQAHEATDGSYHLFGALGIDGVLRINGPEENDMGFELNGGFVDDIRKIGISLGSKLEMSLHFVNINPSVTIPLPWHRTSICFGIGTEVLAGQKVTIKSEGYYYGSTNTDTLNTYLRSNSRPFMPYISLGFAKSLGQHFRIELNIKPTLLNLYEPGTANAVNASGGYGSIDYRYQPVYVGIRLTYLFKSVS